VVSSSRASPASTSQDAADLTFPIVSVEDYFLVTALGWPPEEWEGTTVSILNNALLGPTARVDEFLGPMFTLQ